jgi:uncharacterized protein YlaI
MSDLNQYPRIYCSNCGETKTLLVDEMRADRLNDHDAVDLMCSDCHLVVATLHAPVSGSKVTGE